MHTYSSAARVSTSVAFVLFTSANVNGFVPPMSPAITSQSGHRGIFCITNDGSPQHLLFVGRGIDDFDQQQQDATANNIIAIDDSDDTSSSSPLLEKAQTNDATNNPLEHLWEALTGGVDISRRPPLNVEDTNVLQYDIFLLMNLAVSISFFVVHRLDFNMQYVTSSFHEGALLSICWIVAGLTNGSFLYSAVDGHYDPRGAEYAEKGGPKAAGLLALSTYVTTSSLRIMFALVFAVLDHRQVGTIGSGEELISLEIVFGLVLMSLWRAFHSDITPRV